MKAADLFWIVLSVAVAEFWVILILVKRVSE